MKFYRYQETSTPVGSWDYDLEIFRSYGHDDVKVELEIFELVKETPKGYWIVSESWVDLDEGFISLAKKWISKTSRKRFAYPTKQEALDSFLIRKKKQIEYVKRSLTNAEKALELGEKIKL